MGADFAMLIGCDVRDAFFEDPMMATEALVAEIKQRSSLDAVLRINLKGSFLVGQAVAREMAKKGSGSIINVSSVAGFAPGARAATYSASKAWVTNFSESLHLQYAEQGVRVLALCPGFTRTEFHSRADMDVSGVPDRMWLAATDVVRTALADLDAGRSLSVPGAQYKAIVAATRVIPPSVQRAVLKALQSRFPGRT